MIVAEVDVVVLAMTMPIEDVVTVVTLVIVVTYY